MLLLLSHLGGQCAPRRLVRLCLLHLGDVRQPVQRVLQDVHKIAKDAPSKIREEIVIPQLSHRLDALVRSPQFLQQSCDDISGVELIELVPVYIETLDRVHHRVRANQRRTEGGLSLGRRQHAGDEKLVRRGASYSQNSGPRGALVTPFADEHRLKHLNECRVDRRMAHQRRLGQEFACASNKRLHRQDVVRFTIEQVLRFAVPQNEHDPLREGFDAVLGDQTETLLPFLLIRHSSHLYEPVRGEQTEPARVSGELGIQQRRRSAIVVRVVVDVVRDSLRRSLWDVAVLGR